MPDAPQIGFDGSPPALTQRLGAGGATGAAVLSGEGRDLRLVVDGRRVRLAYRSAHARPDGGYEALAEDESVHVQTLLSPGPGFLSVVSRLTALRPLRLSGFEHAYRFEPPQRRDRPEHLWLPLLPGRAGRALAIPALRTPCVALQSGSRFAALIGDLDALEVPPRLQPVLDIEPPATLRAGLAAGRLAAPGVLARRPAEGVLLPDHDVATLSFLIVLAVDAQPQAGLGRALRVVWSRLAARRLDDLALQAICFEEHARYAYDGAFDRYALWRDVFLEQGSAGGFAAATARRDAGRAATSEDARRPWRRRARAALSRHVPWRERIALLARRGDRAPDHLHFGAGANGLRTAYGMAHFAGCWGNERLAGAARGIVRLALAAPETHGLFPAVYIGTPDRAAWANGVRGALLDDRYVTADLCESGLWMLRLAGDLGLDTALLERARRLGDTLLGAQSPEGAFPPCLTVSPLGAVHRAGGKGQPAVSAAAGAFLAHLARATGEKRFLAAAAQAAALVIDHVWPVHAWRGAEIHPAGPPRPRGRDRRTGLAPQDTLPMAWSVDLLLALREAEQTGWLDPALAILDELLLHQQVWNTPLLGWDGRGGFGATNADARFGDARAALAVPLLLRAYRATGSAEYGLRAAAALRAAFALMLVPENAALAPGNTAGITEAEFGLSPAWRVWAPGGDAAPDALCFDWGSGSACAAAAWAQRHFGDLFVHFGSASAVGLNGCRVIAASISRERLDLRLERIPLPMHRRSPAGAPEGALLLRAQGLSLPRVRLLIDGADLGEVDRKALLAGLSVPLPLPSRPDPGAVDAPWPQPIR